MTALVAGHPLLGLPGVGPLTAARLVAEAGDVERFRSPAAFVMLAAVAPIPASSGDRSGCASSRPHTNEERIPGRPFPEAFLGLMT